MLLQLCVSAIIHSFIQAVLQNECRRVSVVGETKFNITHKDSQLCICNVFILMHFLLAIFILFFMEQCNKGLSYESFGYLIFFSVD